MLIPFQNLSENEKSFIDDMADNDIITLAKLDTMGMNIAHLILVHRDRETEYMTFAPYQYLDIKRYANWLIEMGIVNEASSTNA